MVNFTSSYPTKGNHYSYKAMDRLEQVKVIIYRKKTISFSRFAKKYACSIFQIAVLGPYVHYWTAAISKTESIMENIIFFELAGEDTMFLHPVIPCFS